MAGVPFANAADPRAGWDRVLPGDRLTPVELVGAALLLHGSAGASGPLDGVASRLRPAFSLTLFAGPPYNPDEITRD